MGEIDILEDKRYSGLKPEAKFTKHKPYRVDGVLVYNATPVPFFDLDGNFCSHPVGCKHENMVMYETPK